MKKGWKGLAVVALVMSVSPLVGATAGAAVAVEPTAVKAAAATEVFPGPNPLVYPERAGERLRNHPEQVAHSANVHAASVAECKAYVPYSHRNDRNGWMAFCDGLAKPTVSSFQVKNVVTGEVR